MDKIQCFCFEGNVQDFKLLLKAVEYALSFFTSSNSSFIHNVSPNCVRMDFRLFCDCSSSTHVQILDVCGK